MTHTGIRLKVTVPDHAGDQQPILLADSDWLHMNAIMQGGPPDLTPEMVFEGKPPEYPWVPILRQAKQESGLVVPGIEIWIQAVNLADSYPDDEMEDPEEL